MTDLVNSCLALEDRRCYACDSTETYVGIQRGKPHHHWYGNGNDQWLCLRCENHLIKGPRYHPLTNPRTHKKNYKTCNCGNGHRAKPSSGVTENYSSLSSSMEEIVSQFASNINKTNKQQATKRL